MNMLLPLFIFAGVLTIFTIVMVIIVIKIHVGTARNALKRVAEEAGGRVEWSWFHSTAKVAGRRHRTRFTCTYTPQTKVAPPFLTVTLALPQKGFLRVRRRNFLDRISRGLGLVRPVTTGDPSFDGDFHVITADRRAAAHLLSDDRFRDLVGSLLEEGFTEVRLEPEGISLTRKLAYRETIPPDLVRSILDRLWRLSDAFPETVRGGHVGAALSGTAMRYRVGAPLAILLLGGLALWIGGVELYPPLFSAFTEVGGLVWPYCLGGFLAYLTFTWLSVRHRTDRHEAAALVVALGLPGIFVAAFGAAYSVNGFLDVSPAMEQRGRVAEVYTKGRGGKKIRFSVDGGLSAGQDRPQGTTYRIGDPVVLTVHRGWLEIPWVSDWRTDRGDNGNP